jgi:hypothetical protein
VHPERRPKPDRVLEALGARLRGLPQPPVPVELEARLLATIPPPRPVPQRRWIVRVRLASLAGALAAACLLAVLASAWRHLGNLVPRPPTTESVSHDPSRPSDDSVRNGPAEARLVLDGAPSSSFAWPLENALTSFLPPDGLD